MRLMEGPSGGTNYWRMAPLGRMNSITSLLHSAHGLVCFRLSFAQLGTQRCLDNHSSLERPTLFTPVSLDITHMYHRVCNDDGSSKEPHFPIVQCQYPINVDTNMLQQQTQHQNSRRPSPPVQCRRDSAFQSTPSTAPRPSSSQHLHEVLPGGVVRGSPYRPAQITRSTSQYSSHSRYSQQSGGPHHIWHDPAGNMSCPAAAGMSRSTSWFSDGPAMHQPTHQPSSGWTELDTSSHRKRRRSDLPWRGPPIDTITSTNTFDEIPPGLDFDFDVDDIMQGSVDIVKNRGRADTFADTNGSIR